ncbi:coiled-coil domain-containing protein [Pseudomonas kulmbachensis]|uniref:Phage protein n=1 Tax=Pseudomonas kulmbachensis TaxID=3043408 RepID=A0ABW7LTS7_9PSED
MPAEQQLITIDDISVDNAPAIYVAGGLGRFLEAVTAEVTAEVPDLSTRKGRERIASLAAKVSKSKSAVEKPGRDYLKRLKEMPKVVETELREFVTKMDALRDATRQPLTDWEQAELARTDKHVDGVQDIKDSLVFEGTPTASAVTQVIATLELVLMDDSWEEFLAEAAQAKDQTLVKLRALLAERTQYESEQAELVRLRAEAEAQAQRDREAEIARAAAEKTRIEAEQQAQAEREATLKREADTKAAADRRELELKYAAEQSERAAAQAAREKIESEQRAAQQKIDDERRHRQAMAQAEADRIAAEQRAEQERINSESRQAEAAERARIAEVARQHAAADEERRQTAVREANKAHQAKINRAALEAFITGGMTEECAKQAITLIAQRKIPAISISY